MLHGSAGHRLGARQTAYPFLVAENPSRVGFADQARLNAPASRELLHGEAAKGKTYQAVRHIHQDSEAYKKATGMGNERILRNLAAVRSAYPHLPIHLRTPLISGINDNEELIRRIVELACSMDAFITSCCPTIVWMSRNTVLEAGSTPMAALHRWTPGSCGTFAAYRRRSCPGKGLMSV